MNEKIKLQLRFDDKYLYYIKEHNCSEVAHPAFETNLLSLWGDKKIEKIWNKK